MTSLLPLDAVITPFLKKLLTLTSSVTPDVGYWDSQGAVFIVLDGVGFEAVLKNYFKGTLQTFIRQLHFYGFSKSDLPRLGPHAWSFAHPCFLKDSPEKVAEIRRKSHGQSPMLSSTATPFALRRPSSLVLSKGNTPPSSTDTSDHLAVSFQSVDTRLRENETYVENEIKELKEKVRLLEEFVRGLAETKSTKQEDEHMKDRKPSSNKKRKLSSAESDSSTSSTSCSKNSGKTKDSGSTQNGLSPMDGSGSGSDNYSSKGGSACGEPSKSKRACSALTDEFIKDLASGFPEEVTPPGTGSPEDSNQVRDSKQPQEKVPSKVLEKKSQEKPKERFQDKGQPRERVKEFQRELVKERQLEAPDE